MNIFVMNSKQLHYFTAIYETGTLTKASDQVRVAVSALSHHLANLEAELGTTLFIRKPRGLVPTAAGNRLYDHAKAILRSIAAAEMDIRDAGREIAGDVSIGLAYSAVKAIGVTLFQRVLQDYPKLRLSLSESLSGSTLMHLMDSEVDLALVYNPPQDPGLRTQAVLEERMVCVGTPDLIGNTSDPIRFDDLLELPLIILRQGLSARALMDDAALLKRLESKARFQMNSVYAIAGSLQAGLGCAIGTRLFMKEHLESGVLAARPIVEPELSRTLFMCELADRPATFALETVRSLTINLALQAIGDGTWDAIASKSGKRPS
jgi:LysR family nitrogen assimilation transcriptional regulator